MQRIRIRYAKRGRLRFTSHRDFARAFERALRRARVPMAYSAGFTPHPKISYIGAAPTGVASEAEYLEIGLARSVDVDELRDLLDAALPPGLDILEAVLADEKNLAERVEASAWRIELPQVRPGDARRAVEEFLAVTTLPVERLTKKGKRTIDVREPVVFAAVTQADEPGDISSIGASSADTPQPCAILVLVVRHTTPVVRPDDVLTGLRLVAGLTCPVPARATRIAQGMLSPQENAPPSAADLRVEAVQALVGEWIADPLAART